MSLSIKNLSKTYSNGVKAIDNLDLTINKGMFGLLGPNGAGKSSLMRTIATLQEPDQGSIHFETIDILANKMDFRKTLGYLPQEFGVYAKDSAESLLKYFAILKGIQSKKDRLKIVDEVLELTNLNEVRKKKVSTFSGGMRQRFGIAQLLLNNPKVIIVDEPTAGLDPAERNRFLNVLRGIGSDNIVIFSTHLVDDIKDLCNDMAIINQGRLLNQQPPRVAVDSLSDMIWIKEIAPNKLVEYEDTYQVLSNSYNEDNNIIIRIYATSKPDPSFLTTQPTLEDFYFKILNESSI